METRTNWTLLAVGCAVAILGCNRVSNPAMPEPTSRTDYRGVAAASSPSPGLGVALSGQPSAIGGLNLYAYCLSVGYSGVTLTGPQVGPNAAFNNWRCLNTEDTHPFSMERACQWQYSRNAVQAHPVNPDDAYTWVCYAVGP